MLHESHVVTGDEEIARCVASGRGSGARRGGVPRCGCRGSPSRIAREGDSGNQQREKVRPHDLVEPKQRKGKRRRLRRISRIDQVVQRERQRRNLETCLRKDDAVDLPYGFRRSAAVERVPGYFFRRGADDTVSIDLLSPTGVSIKGQACPAG